MDKNLMIIYQNIMNGYPSGLVFENRPAHAGDMGSIPGPERHATEQLSLHAPTTEPVLCSLGVATTKPCATSTKACKPRTLSLEQEKPQQ